MLSLSLKIVRNHSGESVYACRTCEGPTTIQSEVIVGLNISEGHQPICPNCYEVELRLPRYLESQKGLDRVKSLLFNKRYKF